MTCFCCGGHREQYNSRPKHHRYVNNITFGTGSFRLINASIQQHCSCATTDEVWVSCCRTVISESTTAVWKKLRILFRSGRYAYVKGAPKCIFSTPKIKQNFRGASPDSTATGREHYTQTYTLSTCGTSNRGLVSTQSPGVCWLVHSDQMAKQGESFYLRDAVLARVFATATCLFVRPMSVTSRYCVKTKKASVMISLPSGSPETLVFWRQISSPNSKGFPRTGASKRGGVRKFSDFLALLT